MIRVVSGIYRSRLLSTPDVETTRPTKDRVREGVFNALREDLYGKTLLDLFAGSGAMGIEALSNNVKFVTFCDFNKTAFKVVNDNLRNLNVEKNKYEVVFGDYLDFLYQNKRQYDIVILDPPYAKECYFEIIDLMIKNNLISEKGIFVCECNKKIDFSNYNFTKIKEYKYGYSLIYILRR